MSVAPTDCSLDDRPIQRRNDVICFGAPIALPRSYRVWGYPWTVLVFGIAGLAISLNLWLARPVRSSIGLAIILLGAFMRKTWDLMNFKDTPERQFAEALLRQEDQALDEPDSSVVCIVRQTTARRIWQSAELLSSAI